MRVLLCTDSFPPGCGGSGWSTFELARGLVGLGHDVRVVQPRPGRGAGVVERDVDGLRVVEFGSAAPDLPFVRNYFKNERLRARLAAWLTTYVVREQVDVVHGQHVLTGLPSIDAAAAAGVPSVCTVRDYWPVCYWSDLIHDPSAEHLCPACSPSAMTRCIRPRAGALWPLVLPLVPYMSGNLRRKREGLAACNAVVAVSTAIAADLRARAPELAGTRLETIPNPVDLGRLRAVAARAPRPLDGPYGLFVGKLAVNKGVAHLVPALAGFFAAHPAVAVELVEAAGAARLAEDGFDLAIRVTETPAPGLVVRRLATSRVLIVAAPGYLARQGAPQAPADLTRHRCVGFTPLAWRDTWRVGGESMSPMSGARCAGWRRRAPPRCRSRTRSGPSAAATWRARWWSRARWRCASWRPPSTPAATPRR